MTSEIGGAAVSDRLRIADDVLAQAHTALVNAGAVFTHSGSVQVGADYGAEQVEDALFQFAAALSRASEGFGEQAASQGRWASSTQASFAQLDARVASSVPSANGR